MQKILMILVLLFLVCSLVAQAKSREEQIAYFSPKSHNMNIFITELGESEKIYFSDEITIAKEDIPYLRKFAFTLAKNFMVDEVLVEDVISPVVGVEQYSSLYFNNKVSEEEIAKIATHASIYEVELPYYEDLTGDVTLTIKYILNPTMESESFSKVGNDYDFLGEYFWYPRNVLTEKQNMNLAVNTLEKYEVNSPFVTNTKVNNNIKTTNLEFNNADTPINLTIKKR